MEKLISEAMGELIDLMKSRNVDRDTCIGILLTLKTEDNYVKMQKWIEQNKSAKQTEIMQHLYTFLPTVPYYTMPTRISSATTSKSSLVYSSPR